MQKRIYLDNAATSWPKPESVYQAIEQYQRVNGCGLSRTTSTLADEVKKTVDRLREQLKALAGSQDGEVVFTFNGTDALNLAIHGTLKPGDHVITTVAEHNSVLRPLRTLEDQGVISVTRLACDSLGRIDPADVENSLRPETGLVSIIHSSNVTGARNDIASIGSIVRNSNAMFLVDAAQSIGNLPIDFDRNAIDMVAFPGHKGLFGPLGTGALIVGSRAQQRVSPIRQGGTGASSDSDLHPIEFPDAFEAGNHNVPGLVGLAAGVSFLVEQGPDKIVQHKKMLTGELLEALSEIRHIQLISNHETQESGMAAFNLDLSAIELATILDSSFGVQIRAGHHCASLIHPYIGAQHGCARVSLSFFNTQEDVNACVNAIRTIAEAI